MGVYINMEMPKSCRYCAFRHMSLTENAFCTAANVTINYMDERTKRLDNCPLVPVPEHGDLIDKSGVEVLSWTDGEYGTTFDDGVLFALDKLDELPVIIPADKEVR